MIDEQKTLENPKEKNQMKSVFDFFLKTLIVTIAITASIGFLMPDIPEFPRIPETEKNKLILLSFVQNPYVLWRLSQREEIKGNLENAATYIEAAIGLMEMNGASEKNLEKYRNRLEKLKNK